MPSACDHSDSGNYAVRHNPAVHCMASRLTWSMAPLYHL
jgi:hypothetical protein